MRIHVSCHAGYREEETPRALKTQGGSIAIKEIQDRWLAPDHRYFRVLGEDGAVYILRHDTEQDIWELTFYKSKDCPDIRV
ncbi:MAG: hypothetical protein JRI97_02825 [Deltaproteobacteria bacterium]|nr:hypothetical protein [Deltaproteobacteria bacterium]